MGGETPEEGLAMDGAWQVKGAKWVLKESVR